MKLQKILRSKKGIALEEAIVFMLIIFMLCSLLTTLALIGHYQVRLEKIMLLQDVEIDQIGEDYLTSLAAETDFDKVYDNYTYEVSGNALNVWKKTDEAKQTVLYVEAERVEGNVSVKAWRYTLPEETE